ncbi:polygalacturonase At1g48100-like [Nymphaea colorata]|uniref:polygalacturonase At1g48100-like n=1 Tax=Nymphaea colorata TaxID=210225 RepID=UPI00129D6812|nr:polygalacturonase At1g48100-like [Nymphaea colorata]
MSPKNSVLFLLFLLFHSTPIFLCDLTEGRHVGNGRKHNNDHHGHWGRKGNNGRPKGPNPPAHSPPPSHSDDRPYSSRVFDILSFGAAGDGVTDDSKALLQAWEAACSVGSATIEIPSEFKFLIRPVTLKGPCRPDLVLKIDGVIMGPSDLSDWPHKGLLQWINLMWVHDFTIRGNGIVDGRGSHWWEEPESLFQESTYRKSKIIPDTKPTAIRFYGSQNVTVRDISIVNSPQCHLKFDGSGGIRVSNITIMSPGNSPNTDGIHLQNTNKVEITDATIGCGDDCISIQTGCSEVYIHRVNCGPGHGISLGSLGRDNSLACVNNITAKNITIQDALSGVRIKTWQGGKGWVRGVTFSDVSVSNVETPIVIDQFYCDRRSCRNSSDAVAVSDVTFNGVRGTYARQPVYLACSDARPCEGVRLTDVELSPASERHLRGLLRQPLCWNAYGETRAPLLPQGIDCLQKGGAAALLLSGASAQDSHPSDQCLP